MDIKYISAESLEEILTYEKLIPRIEEAFAQDYNIPMRHHHQYPNPKEGIDSTLLLMPAWDNDNNLGVKIVNVSPNNRANQLPTIQGLYLYFDLQTGTPKAIMDGKTLTTKRTAAASALASQYLSNPESDTMLMIGTGALSKELISAHCTVRPIKKVFVWGRSYEKAKKIANEINIPGTAVIAVSTIEEKISEVAIISCATLSTTPLILGKTLRPGQHLDMVGAYKPNMREMDDETIRKVNLFVDTRDGASKETGDLVIPIREGNLSLSDIKADLFDLTQRKFKYNFSHQEITCFKSVGHALEDLAAGQLAYAEYKT